MSRDAVIMTGRAVLEAIRDIEWGQATMNGVEIDGRKDCTVTLSPETMKLIWNGFIDSVLENQFPLPASLRSPGQRGG